MLRVPYVVLLGLILIWPLFHCSYAQAQYWSNPEEVISRALAMITNEGEIRRGFETLLRGTSLDKEAPEGLDRLVAETNRSVLKWGPITGFEILSRETAGGNLMRLAYVIRLENHPLLMEFHLYRSHRGWLVKNINFTDEFWKKDLDWATIWRK